MFVISLVSSLLLDYEEHQMTTSVSERCSFSCMSILKDTEESLMLLNRSVTITGASFQPMAGLV